MNESLGTPYHCFVCQSFKLDYSMLASIHGNLAEFVVIRVSGFAEQTGEDNMFNMMVLILLR